MTRGPIKLHANSVTDIIHYIPSFTIESIDTDLNAQAAM